jgi:tripartite-type tricarboxylate transporter receptor subunit TctC
MKRRILQLLLALASCVSGAWAQPHWPDKLIQVVVPFTAGVGGDLIMRTISNDLAERVGEPIIIDNRDGAAGNVVTMVASRSAPDGYTFLVAQTSNFVVNHLLYHSFTIDPIKAFTPVMHLGTTPSVLLTNLNVPANDMKAFIAAVKAQKGKINFGNPGVGTPVHVTLEAMNRSVYLGMTSVSYRGATQVVTGLLSGELQVGFALEGPAKEYIESGKLKPVAILSSKRSPTLPHTPTFAELGMGKLGGNTWWVMVAPTGTPAPILDRMNTALKGSMASAEVRAKLLELGILPVASTRQEAANFMKGGAEHWTRSIRELNIPVLD